MLICRHASPYAFPSQKTVKSLVTLGSDEGRELRNGIVHRTHHRVVVNAAQHACNVASTVTSNERVDEFVTTVAESLSIKFRLSSDLFDRKSLGSNLDKDLVLDLQVTEHQFIRRGIVCLRKELYNILLIVKPKSENCKHHGRTEHQ